jgi:hypothetical protein
VEEKKKETTANAFSDEQKEKNEKQKVDERFQQSEQLLVENDANTVFKLNYCKLFVLEPNAVSWSERGVGSLKLIDINNDEAGMKIMMWTDKCFRNILNTKLFEKMQIDRANKKSIRFNGFDAGTIRIFLIKTGNPADCDELYELLNVRLIEFNKNSAAMPAAIKKQEEEVEKVEEGQKEEEVKASEEIISTATATPNTNRKRKNDETLPEEEDDNDDEDDIEKESKDAPSSMDSTPKSSKKQNFGQQLESPKKKVRNSEKSSSSIIEEKKHDEAPAKKAKEEENDAKAEEEAII